MRLPGKRRDNGLYLAKFETKEEAIEYINTLKRKYLYTPNPKNMSIRKLCRYAKNEGVVVYPKQLGIWFKEMGIEIRNVNPRPKKRYDKTFTLNEDVIEVLENYPNQSRLVELGLRLVMGLETDSILVFLPVEKDEEPINIIFKKEKNKVKALATGTLNIRDKTTITQLVDRAQREGMQVIIDFAKLHNYRYYGRETFDDNNEDERVEHRGDEPVEE